MNICQEDLGQYVGVSLLAFRVKVRYIDLFHM